MTLSEQLRLMPFLRIFTAFAVGILTTRFVTAPDWIVTVIAISIYGTAWMLHRRPWGQAYVLAAVGMTGIVISILSDTPETMPRERRLAMIVQVQETPVNQGRWGRTTAQVGYFRLADFANNPDTLSSWQTCQEKIQLYIDTSYQITPGETFSMFGYLHPIDSRGTSYGRLMRSRGLSARSYLTPGNRIAQAPASTPSLALRAATIQHRAVHRLSKLQLNETDRNLLITVVAGERRGLDRTLRAQYARTGVAHILAVSGLHMGFILILVNLLTGWIVLFRRGHLIRNVLVIAALWSYAVMAGLSPSVIRAALMMSLAQITFGLSIKGDRYNLLLGAATLMLAIHPHYLFDISFQLSFLAVLSILFLYPRLYRRKLSRNRWIDALWSSLLLGVAAQIGTLPLIAYSFGNLPLIAIFINPVVILCSFLTVSAGFLWLLLPFDFLNSLISHWISGCLYIQNSLIEYASTWPVAAIEGVRPNGWWITGIYLVLIGSAIARKIWEDQRKPILKA